MLSVLGAAGRAEPCCVHGGFPGTQPCLKSRKVCTVFNHTWVSLTAANAPDLTGASPSPLASCGGGNVPSPPSLGLGAPTFSARLFQVAPQCPSTCFYSSVPSEKAALSPCKPAHSANCQPGVFRGVFYYHGEDSTRCSHCISPCKGLELSSWCSILGELPLPALWPRSHWDLGFAVRRTWSPCEPAAGPLRAVGLCVRGVSSLVLNLITSGDVDNTTRLPGHQLVQCQHQCPPRPASPSSQPPPHQISGQHPELLPLALQHLPLAPSPHLPHLPPGSSQSDLPTPSTTWIPLSTCKSVQGILKKASVALRTNPKCLSMTWEALWEERAMQTRPAPLPAHWHPSPPPPWQC